MNGKIALFVLLAVTFSLGAVSTLMFTNMGTSPLLEGPLFFEAPKEQNSPGNTVREEQIKVYKNKAELIFEDPNSHDEWLVHMDLDSPSWSTFTDTNSMDPVFDIEANTIRLAVPAETLQIGDIVSYQHGENIIIHRIVHIDNDEEGLYFILKGDNNPTSDPGKVRASQILGKIVAIIY